MNSKNVRQDSNNVLEEGDDSGFTEIFNELESKTTVNQINKSSHWDYHLKGFDKDEILKDNILPLGFGGFSGRSLRGRLYHALSQRLLFSELGKYWSFKSYRVAKQVAKKQNRNIDFDLLRHVFTFNLLINQNSYISNPHNVCVIGDGMSNFLSIAIGINFGSKLVSINLPEVLMNDLILLMRLGIVSSEVKIAQNKGELSTYLNDTETRIILVVAADSTAVADCGIDLFVNICSFQEMTLPTINTYFDLIKSNSAMFYCCNREKKVLYGGETIIFDQYPWGKCEVAFDEECPWNKFFYQIRTDLKFKRETDGRVRHKLVSYQEVSDVSAYGTDL
jgi:hypothetical protein